ncbi:MAG: DUF3179 domain-containing protein [Paracoccaceae bacterium]
MPLTRRSLLAAPALALPTAAFADAGDLPTAVRSLVFGQPMRPTEAMRVIAAERDPSLAPALIFALRFTRADRRPIVEHLAQLTGAAHEDWFDWMLWQEAHPAIRPAPWFVELKREVFLAIDPNFSVFLRPEYLAPDRMKIRLEEITWGGVHKDGIPSLDNPPLIAAEAADYLRPDDLVFGVAINGDVRAYPLRIMGWHEMFNEVIGGVPVALAYCTLCGAGILFETQPDWRETPYIFGSSGFLYRSNKLMFDRETHSLWNQFTGKPVVGPLVDSLVELRQRPVVIAPWAEWQTANPTTRVLSLATGHSRDYGSGVVYRQYFASPELMFPTRTDERRLRQKDYVFGIRLQGAAKAWPLAAFAGGRAINDRVGDLAVVLVGDADGRTVRAYERGGRTFRMGEAPGTLDAADGGWRILETALEGPNGARLPRVAGHVAYWFAWDGYLGARSDLWTPNR